MSDLHELSAVEQIRGMRAGEVSPRDLVEHYLDRIDRHDATLGTFITVVADEAREAAVAAERMLAKKGAEGQPPLFGLPIAIKDLHPTAGIRTTMGSAAFADFVPDADGVAVGAIRRAGAIVLGKTHAP
ncbi:MAG: amidase, partial [Actinobacteria bacterium]|nr:amidase [Actinomycetota bacterium]